MDHTEARDMADARDLHIAMDAIVTALDALRAGRLRLDRTRDEDTLSTISTALHQLTCRLAPRLQGATDALIRAHYDAGGSHGELAAAMEVERSTAQYQGDRVRKTAPPSHWERWAAGELEPTTARADAVRPGWTLITHGHHMQVSEVRVYGTGRVELAVAAAVEVVQSADAEVTVVPREVPTSVTAGTHTWADGDSVDVTIYRRA